MECNGCRVAFILGNGRRVRFWLDRWCGDDPLKEALLFPMFWFFLMPSSLLELLSTIRHYSGHPAHFLVSIERLRAKERY